MSLTCMLYHISNMADGGMVSEERIPFNFFKKIPKIVSIIQTKSF